MGKPYLTLTLALAIPGLASAQISDYNYFGVLSVQTWGSSHSYQHGGTFMQTSSYYVDDTLVAYAQASGTAEFSPERFYSSSVADIVNFAQWQGAQADMAGMQAILEFEVEPGWYSLSYQGSAGTSGTSQAEGWFRFRTDATGWIRDVNYFVSAGFSDGLDWQGYLPGGMVYLSWGHSLTDGFAWPSMPAHAAAFQTLEFQAVPEPSLAIAGVLPMLIWRRRAQQNRLGEIGKVIN